jgi:hypothetical protein
MIAIIELDSPCIPKVSLNVVSSDIIHVQLNNEHIAMDIHSHWITDTVGNVRI